MSSGISWILIIVIGVVGLFVQWRLKSVFAKYSKVMAPGGLTGAQIAQKMLNDNGIYDVQVTCISGQLTDHYDPTKKTVNLSGDVPVVSISSSVSMIVILIGIVIIKIFPVLFWIGIGMFALVFLFSVITLPVEFNASHRALVWLQESNSLSQQELKQAKNALSWAASTYVVAALSSLASLLYYISIGNSRR